MRQDGEPAGRIFVTCDIGADALARLQRRGYVLEVYPETAPPPYVVNKEAFVDSP